VARASLELVVSAAATEEIVAGTASEQVGSRSTFEAVVSEAPLEQIRSLAAIESVMDWLQPRAARGTIVKTVRQVIGGPIQPPPFGTTVPPIDERRTRSDRS